MGSEMQPSTEWKEQVAPDEDERFERYAEELRAMQRTRANGGARDRALHAKGQAGLEAEFTVLPEVPSPARAGLFAQPGTYRAYVRVSNGAGARQSDRTADVRGLAVKVVGARGKKIIPGMEDAPTQDFLCIRTPSTPVRNPDEFLRLVRAAQNPALTLPRLIGGFGLVGGVRLLRDVLRSLGAPMFSVATTRYYSAAPIACGAYAVHYALEPELEAPAAWKGKRGPEWIGAELAARLREGPVAWRFQLQFFVDEAATPIEDNARVWASPFVTVGRLVLPKQDPDSPRGRAVAAFVEGLSFDPWHALVEHRPLGGMMRARNHAYRLSTKERGAAAEPDGSETFSA